MSEDYGRHHRRTPDEEQRMDQILAGVAQRRRKAIQRSGMPSLVMMLIAWVIALFLLVKIGGSEGDDPTDLWFGFVATVMIGMVLAWDVIRERRG